MVQQGEKKEESKLVGPELEGDCLMVMQGEKLHQEPKVTIFKTTCLCKGKICKVVVDSGSQNNIVSLDMITKLGIVPFDHPSPYKATWVNQQQHVEVRKRAFVNFSIGSYQDRVLCDVVPMTCTHLILGRPW